MITPSNKERLEQEIANLIKLIAKGRDFFFEKTGLLPSSSDDWLNHREVKDLFQEHYELIQTELNIQLLYIKIPCYYAHLGEKNISSKKARNAFSHESTDLIFSKRSKYNFFLHTVSCNFKKNRIHFLHRRRKRYIH